MKKRFIHIPKTAGIAVSKWIVDNKLPVLIGPAGIPKVVEGIPRAYHKTAQWYLNNGETGIEMFSIVRNPYDRAVSHYHYHLKKGSIPSLTTFKEFVKQKIAPGTGFQPQYTFICDDSGNLLINKFFKYESFESDIQKYLNCQNKITTINESTPTDLNYQDFYTDELKFIIENVYATDFKLFGYTKD